MPTYMFLLHNDPDWYKQLSPEEMQKATEKYTAWMKNPFVTDGKRLAGDPGRVSSAPTPASPAPPTAPTAKARKSLAATTPLKPQITTKRSSVL